MSNPALQVLDPSEPRKRKRLPRASIACETCRKRKAKCDQANPCSNCVRHSFECTYREKDNALRMGIPLGPAVPQSAPSTSSRDLVVHHLPSNQDLRSNNLMPSTAGTTAEIEVAAILSSSKGQWSSANSIPPKAGLNSVPHMPSGSSISSISSPLPTRTSIAESNPPIETRTPITVISAPDTDLSASALSGVGGWTSDSPDQANDTGQSADGLGEVNRNTHGTEFYGSIGTFYFLNKLRARAANSQNGGPVDSNSPAESRGTVDTSVVNLLHSSDYSVRRTSSGNSQHHNHIGRESSRPLESAIRTTNSNREAEIERECLQLYFQNLHYIHPILSPSGFLSRCEAEVWNRDPTSRSSDQSRRSFLALFYAVLSVGAVTAGEASSLVWPRTLEFLEELEPSQEIADPPPYPPIRLGRIFFERAKQYLGDIFEACSFETVQTLYMMSIFCQNALKPHSCYLYTGMAARTALAIGTPNTRNSEQASLLWWSLYAHEIEMCASAGRQASLSDPSHYRVSLPRGVYLTSSSTHLVRSMVDLAQILLEVSKTHPGEDLSLESRSLKVLELDRQLLEWRAQLPVEFDMDKTSLSEPEAVTKQKIVLKLRLFNARTLLFRPFLIAAAAAESNRERYFEHIRRCVEAARSTITLLYEAYLHRPYFRTWWYNCTYALDASMVLLYVVLSNIHPLPAEDLIRDAQKSVDIFKSMEVLTVARRCADVTLEVMAIAQQSRTVGQAVPGSIGNVHQGVPPPEMQAPSELHAGYPFPEDIYATLIDTNLLYGFIDDNTAWPNGET